MKLFKNFAFLLMLGAAVMVSCNPKKEDPKDPPLQSEMPEVAATEGAVTVVWHLDIADMCDVNLVFAGNYNEYNLDPANMAKFEAIPDYKGWYKAVITPFKNEDGTYHKDGYLVGKPCACALDGTFPSSWDHQWIGTEEAPCEILKGSANLQDEYNGEKKIIFNEDADVVYVKSSQFKTNPCVEAVFEDITFNLTTTVPVTEGGIVYIVGDAFEKSWTPDAYPMTKVDANKWTVTLPALVDKEFKFCVNGSWDNDQMAAPAEGADCSETVGNMKVDFVEMNVEVYGFLNFGEGITKCEPAPAE